MVPCPTTHLLVNLQYLDLSDNLLTDMTLVETLCDGNGTMKDLRVLNISGNALKVASCNFLILCRFSIHSYQIVLHSFKKVQPAGTPVISGC